MNKRKKYSERSIEQVEIYNNYQRLDRKNNRRLRDDTKKQSDNEQNRRYKALIRGDQETYAKERMLENDRYKRNKNNYNLLVEIYENAIIDTSDKICICCGGIFFSQSVDKFIEENFGKNKDFLDNIMGVPNKYLDKIKWICKTCSKYCKRNKYPPLLLKGKFEFQEIDDLINDLNEAEALLVSPRIPFMKIRPLKKYGNDKQYGMVGNVVNVPSDQNEILRILPRNLKDSETIQIKIKRRMEYNSDYVCDLIRPNSVRAALKFLVEKDLFLENHIVFDDNDWDVNQRIIDENDGPVAFIKDRMDYEEELCNADQYQIEFQNNRIEFPTKTTDIYNTDKFAACNINFQCDDTMLTNYINKVGIVAPCEMNNPISLIKDRHAEELSFIKIYGGEIVIDYLHQENSRESRISYQQVCKSEFRRYDRRCATNLTKLFYSYKKLVAKKLLSSVEIRANYASYLSLISTILAAEEDGDIFYDKTKRWGALFFYI